MRTILVYNPFSNSGHHESWTCLVLRVLLCRGYNVVCVTPSPQIIAQNLSAIDKRAFRRLQLMQTEGSFNDDVMKEQYSTLSSWAMLERRIYTIFKEIIFAIVRITFPFTKSFTNMLNIRKGLIQPQKLCDCVQRTIKKSRWKPEFLFIMYMDAFSLRRFDWSPFRQRFPLPFGGISFEPCYRYKAGSNIEEPYWDLSAFHGLCVTDERKRDSYAATCPEKIFVTIPDVTNFQLPDSIPEVVREIQNRANDRTVIILGGSIESRKNVLLFLKIANLANPQKWFFVIAGKLYLEGFTTEEQLLLYHLANGHQEHIYVSFCYFSDERDLNSLFFASDIIFAVYKNFKKSSNLITKAAYFEKPILVSDRYLMGERVRRYGIGLTVSEDDSEAALLALEHLKQNPIPSESFAAYRADFNEDAMGDALEKFITASLRTQEEKK